MASSVSRRLTTKLLKPCQYSSSFSSSPAYSISHSPKTFTFDQSRLMGSLFDSSPTRVENPINHDLSFFRFYSSSSSNKFNPSSHLQETLIRPNTKSLLQGKPRNPGLRFFSTPPERDLSALAKEARAVLERLKRSYSDFSNAIVLVGLLDYSCRVTMAYIAPSPLTELTIQSFEGVLSNFLFAFVLQRYVKHMASWNEEINEMEQEGRSGLLAGELRIYKYLNIFCAAGRKFVLSLAALECLGAVLLWICLPDP